MNDLNKKGHSHNNIQQSGITQSGVIVNKRINNEKKLDHSYHITSLVRQTRTLVDELCTRNGLVDIYGSLFKDIENFGKIYDALILWSNSYISIYEGHKPKHFNPAFLDIINTTHDELLRKLSKPNTSMVNLYYRGLNRVKVLKYIGYLERGEFAAYKNTIFPITITNKLQNGEIGEIEKSIAWSAFHIPEENVNIRIGVELYDGMPEEELIKNLNINEIYFYTKKLDDIYNELIKSYYIKNDEKIKNNLRKIFHNYRLYDL